MRCSVECMKGGRGIVQGRDIQNDRGYLGCSVGGIQGIREHTGCNLESL